MNKIIYKKGFTLVEIMVSLMIFSLVVVVALAALVKIVDANRKAQTIQDAVVNLSFAMEAMTREVRTGSNLYCSTLGATTDLNITSIPSIPQGGGCTFAAIGGLNATVFIAFYSNRTDGACRLITAYEFQPTANWTWFDPKFAVKKALQATCGSPITFTPIFSDKSVTINSYAFHISHNNNYPMVALKIDGIAGSSISNKTNFSLQTAASLRIP